MPITRPSFATRPAVRLALLAAGLALLSLAPRAATAPPVPLDVGRLTLSQDGRPARVEDFAIQRVGDSLVVQAASAPWAPREAELRFDKTMLLVADFSDFALNSYSSWFAAGTDTLRRGVSVARGDTVFTLWREFNGHGIGDVLPMPPGRVYVLDPPLFTLFGYVGWTLQGRDCDHRPIRALVLGARDTLVDATVTDAGPQTLEWKGRSVPTRKLLIADQQTTVEAWFTPDGRMLRLEQPRAGIRAERDAPPPADQPARREGSAPGR